MIKDFVSHEIAARVYSGPVSEASTTRRTQLNDSCTRTLEFPLLVRPGFIFIFFLSWEADSGVFFTRIPEEEISDYLAQGSFIRVLTVEVSVFLRRGRQWVWCCKAAQVPVLASSSVVAFLSCLHILELCSEKIFVIS